MFDSARLHGELVHLHRQLSLLASEPRGKHLTEGLAQATNGTPLGLVRQVLFADCLRIIHSAVLADNKMKDEELQAIYPFVSVAARHYGAMNPAHYGDVDALDHVSVRDFLSRYSLDDSPCGRAAANRWPGWTMCKKAHDIGVPEPLERYRQLMSWLIPAACEVGRVKEDDPGLRGKLEEMVELRRSMGTAAATSKGGDQRAIAFVRPTRVFSAVQQASSVNSPDPFDVETIHLDARHAFEGLVRRATSEQQADRGRMMLILGDSGAGKTHLLRSFRRRIHEYGRGFVVYVQLHSSSKSYANYLLQNVIDSLAVSYSGIAGERSGLVELVTGLGELAEGSFRADIEKLSKNNWDGGESTAAYVSDLADRLSDHLGGFDLSLLRVLLYSLSPTPGLLARVHKYLRCQSMTPDDYNRLGVAKPNYAEVTPEDMIFKLGTLAYKTRRQALVIMVDQAELTGHDELASKAFQEAATALQDLVSKLPSAVAVMSCLSDLWLAVQTPLTKSTRDRLEKDPPVQTLRIDRTYPEVAAIISRRLAWLYAEAKVPYLSENPLYPFTPERMRLFEGHRTRTVLEWCHQYQERCSEARRILAFDKDGDDGAIIDSFPVPADDDIGQISMAWNDAVHSMAIELPDGEDEEEILSILSAAAKLLAAEGVGVTVPPMKNGLLKIQVANVDQRYALTIAVANRTYRAGAFTQQIEMLRRGAKNSLPVAVRTSAFPRGPASEKVVNQLLAAGGRAEHLDLSTLRSLVTYTRFKPSFPEERIAEWRRRDRPISSIPVMARIFNLEATHATDGTVTPIVDRASGPVGSGPVRPSSPRLEDVRASRPKIEVAAAPPPPSEKKKRGRPPKAQPKQ